MIRVVESDWAPVEAEHQAYAIECGFLKNNEAREVDLNKKRG